jgi:hypothetical protein
MNAPQSPAQLRSFRSRFLSNCLRWGFGVVGPILCFYVALGNPSIGGSTFFGSPVFTVVFATICMAALACRSWRRGRGRAASLFLGGILGAGCLLTFLYSIVLLIPSFLLLRMSVSVFSSSFEFDFEAFHQCVLLGILGLVPIGAFYIYCGTALDEIIAGTQRAAAIAWLAFVLGLALPPVSGYVAVRIAEWTEARVIATYVDGPRDPEESALRQWRLVARMHNWPGLADIVPRNSWALTPRSRRAMAAYAELTGFHYVH